MVVRQTKPTVAFGLVGATADEAPLSCGDAQKRADRVFQWTASRDKTNVKARAYGIDTADLVIEVFAGSSCVAATSVGCNNDEATSTRLPEAEFTAKAGATYFVVVSSLGPTPSGRFYLNIDD